MLIATRLTIIKKKVTGPNNQNGALLPKYDLGIVVSMFNRGYKVTA